MKIFFVSTLHYILTSRYLLVTSAYLYVTSGSFLLRLVIHMFFVLLWTNFCMFLNMNLSKAHISKTKSWYNAKRYITRFWKVRHCIFNIKSVRIINWQKTKKIVKYMFLPSIKIIDQTLRVNLLKTKIVIVRLCFTLLCFMWLTGERVNLMHFYGWSISSTWPS